jgi:hypothetical protein
VSRDNCTWDVTAKDGYGTNFRTSCNQSVRLDGAIEVGWSPSPTAKDAGKYCSNCGGKIIEGRTSPAEEAHTFKEWKARGYMVKRGEKATGRNQDGAATFTKKQVKWYTPMYNGDYYDLDDFYDDGDRW